MWIKNCEGALINASLIEVGYSTKLEEFYLSAYACCGQERVIGSYATEEEAFEKFDLICHIMKNMGANDIFDMSTIE